MKTGQGGTASARRKPLKHIHMINNRAATVEHVFSGTIYVCMQSKQQLNWVQNFPSVNECIICLITSFNCSKDTSLGHSCHFGITF